MWTNYWWLLGIIKNSEQENKRVCCETETDGEEVQRYGRLSYRGGTKQINYIL